MTTTGSDVCDSSDDYSWDQALDADVEALLDATRATSTATTSAAAPSTATASNARSQDAHLLAQSTGGTGSASIEDTLPALVRHVDYPDLSQLLSDVSSDPADTQQQQPSKNALLPSDAASASPLARFRTAPRKPFSVSDLTAGAWCELQYEYTLTRLPGGRRTRTAAMRAGTRVHARLEEEVHTTVRVQVATREDGFGLRLWNLIQGLRTLRETGLTRELEIWGLVGDNEPQVVNGVIDALSYQNPDPSREEPAVAAGSGSPASKKGRKGKRQETPVQSTRITDFFPSPTEPASSPTASPPMPSTPRKIYITDVKTRGSTRLPSGAAIRPTEMQLFLYHRLLSDLATGRLDFFRVFDRYGLSADASFSDDYVAQIGGLYDEIFADDNVDDVDDVDAASGVVDAATFAIPSSSTTNIRYRTLRLLLSLVQDEVGLTFPHGADSIGDLVSVEYRLRPGAPPTKKWQQFAQQQRRQRRREQTPPTPGAGKGEEEKVTEDDKDDDTGTGTDTDTDTDTDTPTSRCIGTKVLAVDRARLDGYLANYLAWWRGERPAAGVTELEEASLKCSHCEFAADCSWRQALDDARVQHVRATMQAGRGQKAIRG